MTTPREAQQALISEGQSLVYSLAAKIYRSVPVRVDLDDLIAYGELGLAEAARDFDPDQGVRFTTFAYYRVRGAIYDGLSKMTWTSRARFRRLRYQQMANEVLASEAEKPQKPNPSLEDEATWFRGVTEELSVVYLASQMSPEAGIRDSAIEDSAVSTAPSILAQREISQKLIELVDRLPRIEQRLIRTIYFEGATLQDAANMLGISKSWASRLHAKVLEQLARALRKLGEGD
jgi:RNA polymerase sigma factor for flagellar operon FliA